MSFIHYISAVRRLTEIEKTVRMLKSNKYSEADVPPMVLAQRDFIKKEMEYGKPQRQAVAIALNVQREAKKKGKKK